MVGVQMEITKVVSGKKVTHKQKTERQTLLELVNEQCRVINELCVQPADRTPDFPPNWFVHKDLGEQEFNKRMKNLNEANLNIEKIKERLIQAEMVLAYEAILTQRLLEIHIAGRKALSKVNEHYSTTQQNKKNGLQKKHKDKKELAHKIIDEITQQKRPIHQNDFEIFRIKTKFHPSTARKYWLAITKFESTKKIHTT
jgi:hypothetical protein